jgi:hypothetical protein
MDVKAPLSGLCQYDSVDEFYARHGHGGSVRSFLVIEGRVGTPRRQGEDSCHCTAAGSSKGLEVSAGS